MNFPSTRKPWVVLDKRGFVRKNETTKEKADKAKREYEERKPKSGPYIVECWLSELDWKAMEK